MVSRAGEEPIYRIDELGLSCHQAVESTTVLVVVMVVSRSPSKLLAEKEIPNSHGAQSAFEILAIELRRESRIGERANVDDVLDLLPAKKIDEGVELMIGMTN